jgi:undecaprenyl-diphosphatase
MTPFVAFWLGLVQGLTEFFPVSSSGHLVLLQHFFGIRESQLAFDVMVHLGTAVAVIIFTWRELVEILSSLIHIPGWLFGGKLKEAWQKEEGLRLLVWLLVGSIPAGLFGILLQDQLREVFGAPRTVSLLLLVTGLILLWAEGRSGERKLGQIEAKESLLVGLAQAGAILPGISRSGSTIAAGLSLGLTREAAAKFSFLLSLPAIAGAAVLELGDLGQITISKANLAVGFFTSALAGYFAIRFLVQVLKQGKLRGFAYYCFAVGLVSLLAMAI